MLKRTVVVAMLLQGVLSAQDIAGDWQGTLNFGKTERRVVITIVKAAGGGWTATELTPDEGSNGVMANSVTFEASTLKLAFDAIRATYEGTLSDGGNSLQGTLTQGSRVPPHNSAQRGQTNAGKIPFEAKICCYRRTNPKLNFQSNPI